MLKVIFSITGLLLLNVGFGQTLNVYEYDSIYKAEPIIYSSVDTSEGVLTAKYTNYPNQIAFSANYYNHYRNGFVKYYYPDGKLMMTQVFQKSKKNGEYTLYDQTGEIIVKGFYVDNVKDGFWTYRKYQFMGEYKNGLKSGRWKFITADKKKIHYTYKKGVLKKEKVVIPLPNIPTYILRDGVVIVP